MTTASLPETTLEPDQVILDDPIDLPAVIQECKKTQTKEDATSLLKAWEKSLAAAKYFHMEFELKWAHPEACKLLLQRAIAISSPARLFNMFQRCPPGAHGFAFEFLFLYMRHTHQYAICDSKGFDIGLTLDLRSVIRSQSGTGHEHLTIFPIKRKVESDATRVPESQSIGQRAELNTPPYYLVAETIIRFRTGKIEVKNDSDRVWRFDPRSHQHADWDAYALMLPDGLFGKIVIAPLQLTTGETHDYRPARAFKMVEKFKTVVTRVLEVLELVERLKRLKMQLQAHKRLSQQNRQLLAEVTKLKDEELDALASLELDVMQTLDELEKQKQKQKLEKGKDKKLEEAIRLKETELDTLQARKKSTLSQIEELALPKPNSTRVNTVHVIPAFVSPQLLSLTYPKEEGASPEDIAQGKALAHFITTHTDELIQNAGLAKTLPSSKKKSKKKSSNNNDDNDSE